MTEEEVLLVLHPSRKAYIVEYGCTFLLLVFLGVLYLREITLPRPFVNLVLGIAGFTFLFAEISRFSTIYKIMHTKMLITKGIIQQQRKSIHFHPLGFVPDINLKQGRIQRILNYGTVFVSGGTEKSFELQNINRPQKILTMIEELIDISRRKMNQGPRKK